MQYVGDNKQKDKKDWHTILNNSLFIQFVIVYNTFIFIFIHMHSEAHLKFLKQNKNDSLSAYKNERKLSNSICKREHRLLSPDNFLYINNQIVIGAAKSIRTTKNYHCNSIVSIFLLFLFIALQISILWPTSVLLAWEKKKQNTILSLLLILILQVLTQKILYDIWEMTALGTGTGTEIKWWTKTEDKILIEQHDHTYSKIQKLLNFRNTLPHYTPEPIINCADTDSVFKHHIMRWEVTGDTTILFLCLFS